LTWVFIIGYLIKVHILSFLYIFLFYKFKIINRGFYGVVVKYYNVFEYPGRTIRRFTSHKCSYRVRIWRRIKCRITVLKITGKSGSFTAVKVSFRHCFTFRKRTVNGFVLIDLDSMIYMLLEIVILFISFCWIKGYVRNVRHFNISNISICPLSGIRKQSH